MKRGGLALWAAGAASLALGAAIAVAILARGGATPRTTQAVPGSGDWPRTFLNPDGTQTVLPAPPQRIVSLTLPSDEVLIALGAGDRLAAITEVAADPAESLVSEEAKRFAPERRIAVSEGAAERILGMRPDLVVAAPWTDASTIAHLQRADVPIFRFRAGNTIPEIQDDIRTVARAVGLEDAGARLTTEMAARIQRITTLIRNEPKVRTLVCSYTGAELWTGAATTLLDDLIRLAGGVNAASGGGARGYAPISMERILALQPEVVVLASPNASAEDTIAAFRAQPGAAEITAVRDGHVYVIPARLLTTTSQHAADALEAIARTLHPDAFRGA